MKGKKGTRNEDINKYSEKTKGKRHNKKQQGKVIETMQAD